MLKKLFLLAAFSLLLPSICSAQQSGVQIGNPESVSYLHAEVSRQGSVYLFDNSPFQNARDLVVTLAVPQNTSRQFSLIKTVEGPERYYVTEDVWGNSMLSLYWSVPDLKKRITYRIVTDVEVFDRPEAARGTKFPMTSYTAANQDIAQTAYAFAYGLDDMQRLFRLSQWVHENLAYSNDAKSFSESAEWAYSNRKGACDEFSNLLVSMLRTLEYSPRYVVGYAYSEEWGQHGWVEVDHEGKSINLDPTWLESPVDSTHIKLADLPDSNFTEHVEVKGGQITIDWDKGEAEVRVISFQESPRITIGAEVIPANASDSSHALIKTTFSGISSQCVLTSVSMKSCILQDSSEFLSLSRSRQTLAFCGSQEAYWFAGIPSLGSNMIYTCPVIIYGGGAEKTAAVSIESGKRKTLSTAVNSQSVLTPGESFDVQSVTENSGPSVENARLFLFFGGLVESKELELKPGDQATVKWKMKAPGAPGNYELVFFSSSGELVSRNVTVVSQRICQITNISAPGEAEIGLGITVNITVKATSGFSGILKLGIDEFNSTRWVSLGPSESKTFAFFYSPDSSGTKTVSATLVSDSQQYQDGWWGTLMVREQRQWWEEIIAWIEDTIAWIVDTLTGR
jgi:hypothetical protein